MQHNVVADVRHHDLILVGKINLLSLSIQVWVGCLGILSNRGEEKIIVKVSWGRTGTGRITSGFRESGNRRNNGVWFNFCGCPFMIQRRQEGVSSSSLITITSGASGSISESWKSALIIALSAIYDQPVSVGGVECCWWVGSPSSCTPGISLVGSLSSCTPGISAGTSG